LAVAKENEVQAIVGMQSWQEAVLVAHVGSQYELPVLTLEAAPTTLTSAQA
ncbi:hypothetical protein Dimus_000477, partial [Dionaea muscipula]